MIYLLLLLISGAANAYEVDFYGAYASKGKPTYALVKDNCGRTFRLSGEGTKDLRIKLELLINSAMFDECFNDKDITNEDKTNT